MGWPSLGALGVISFLGMGLQAVTGYGENITFQICWALLSIVGLTSGSILEAVAILTIVSLPLLSMQCYLQWRHTNIRLAGGLALSSMATTVAGVELLVHYPGVWLKRSLGLLFYLVFVWQLVMQVRSTRPARDAPLDPFSSKRTAAIVMAAGLASGFTGGAFSLPGPPTMVLTMVMRIKKDEWRGTNACYM